MACDDWVTVTPARSATLLAACAVIVTVSFAVDVPSDTVNSNVYAPAAVGVNVGFAAVVLDSVTVMPLVCLQE